MTGNNDTIENSNFAVGANELIPIVAGASSTNLSVLYDTIDGGGDSGNPSAISALISDTGTGLTVEYNWLKNAPQRGHRGQGRHADRRIQPGRGCRRSAPVQPRAT